LFTVNLRLIPSEEKLCYATGSYGSLLTIYIGYSITEYYVMVCEEPKWHTNGVPITSSTTDFEIQQAKTSATPISIMK